MTIANPTIAPVPVPAGVEHVSEWNDAPPTPVWTETTHAAGLGTGAGRMRRCAPRRRKEDITWLV